MDELNTRLNHKIFKLFLFLSIMRFLQKGIFRVVQQVKKHPFWFIGLMVLQFAFLVLLGYVVLTYQVKIFEEANVIITTLQSAQVDAEKIQAGEPFLEDMTALYRSYQNMIFTAMMLALILSLLFLFFQGGLWLGTQALLSTEKSMAAWRQQWLKFCAVTLGLFGPYFLICYAIIKAFISNGGNPELFADLLKLLAVLLGMVYYVALVGFALLPQRTWKEFWAAGYYLFRHKIAQALFVFVINAAVIALALYFLWLSLQYEQYFSIIVLATVFLIIAGVLCRLFWIAALQELHNERHYR